jgi:hypothetical protein
VSFIVGSNPTPSADLPSVGEAMARQAALVLYGLAMVVIIVGVDILFFRHMFVERLFANISIVLVFGAFYFRFLKRA